MALNTGRRTTFADATGIKENISDRLDFLTPTDLPLLNYIGFMKEAGGALAGADSLSFKCIQPRHTWLNDDLVPSVAEVGSAYTASSGSLVVDTDQGARFDADDIIMVGESYFIVNNVSTDTLTVTALHSDANHAIGETVYLIGNARVEGTAASVITPRTTDFGSTENFTQIFMAKTDMAGSEMATERWGIDGDPYEYQVNKRLKELAIQLERAAMYGRRNTAYPGNNSTARRMGGLAEYIRDNADAIVNDANGEDLDEIILNDVLQEIWTRGGQPDTLMVPGRQKRLINSWIVPAVRVERTENTWGVIVGEYVSDFGSLTVVLNRWMKPSDAIILTSSDLGIGPLKGNGHNRSFVRERLPKDGDYERDMVVGEYTMEVRNATKSHAWIKDLSAS